MMSFTAHAVPMYTLKEAWLVGLCFLVFGHPHSFICRLSHIALKVSLLSNTI